LIAKAVSFLDVSSFIVNLVLSASQPSIMASSGFTPAVNLNRANRFSQLNVAMLIFVIHHQ
jgi:hypothetical protein